MKRRRFPWQSHKSALKKFAGLPPHLQEVVKKWILMPEGKTIGEALGGSEDSSSLNRKPPGGPEEVPPVLFFGWCDFLDRCSLRSLDQLWQRYYGMTAKEREIIRRRLHLSVEEVPHWMDWARQKEREDDDPRSR